MVNHIRLPAQALRLARTGFEMAPEQVPEAARFEPEATPRSALTRTSAFSVFEQVFGKPGPAARPMKTRPAASD